MNQNCFNIEVGLLLVQFF